MLGLVALVLGNFHIAGFWSALFGTLIISLVAWLGNSLIGNKRSLRGHGRSQALMDVLPGIPQSALSWRFVRSSGPGGQNVNKVATAVQLRIALSETNLDGQTKARLLRLAGNRAVGDDQILIAADTHRSQSRNRTEALDRLADLLTRARRVPKARKPTRPSKAQKRQRRDSKRHRGAVKRLRGKPGLD